MHLPRPSWLLILVLMVGLVPIVSCGGATSQGTETTPTVEVSGRVLIITGRVDVPPLEALPALQTQMRYIKAEKVEDLTKGIQGEIHTLGGKPLGSFETNSEGEYQMEISAEDLGGDTSLDVILSTKSGIQQYQTLHDNGAESQTVHLGTADVVTTLATEGILQQLEAFDGGGEGGLGCLYQIEEKIWTLADPKAQTLSQKYGLFKQSIVSLLAQKKGSADPDYDNWHELFNAILTGKIDGTQALSMMNADEFDLKSQSTGTDSGDVYSQVENLLSLLVEEDSASGSTGPLCKGMADGVLDPGVVISPILEVEDLEELQAVYSDESAVKIHVGLMQNCIDEDGCAGIKEGAASILDVMKAFDGDYTQMFDGEGSLDKAALKEIVEAAKTCDTPSGSGKQKSDCVKEKVTEVHDAKKSGEEPPAAIHPPPADPKVTICHIPPGNPANAQTIEVAASALSAHLEHGDYEGECVPEPPPPPPPPPPPEVGGISVLWNYTFGKIFGGFYRMIPGPSAAIGEVRPDLPGLEVATGNEEYHPLGFGGPLGRWFLFQSDGAVAFWKDTENDEAHSSVNLYDLDDDGRLELLGGTTSGNQVQAIDGDGNWFWRHYLSGHSISTPTVATLASDGTPMVFNGCMDNKVRSIDGRTGHLNWAFDTGRWIWSTPAVADLDGDHHSEIVIANDGQYYGNGALYSLDAETGHLNWQQDLGAKVHSSPAVADLDGDGVLEVLIGDGSGLFKAFNGVTGALKWSFLTGGEILSSAAVGDLDGDGDLETVFGSADGRIYALHGNGSLFWSRDLGGAVHSSPALARRHPGSLLHVYVATMSGDLDVLSGMDGSLVSRLAIGYEIASSPVVGDVDGDGKLEVFFQDRRADVLSVMEGDVFWAVRDEASSVPPFAREWPVFRGDPAHTGVYPHHHDE